MKKVEQIAINAVVDSVIDEVNAELSVEMPVFCAFRKCNASVAETKHFYILRSYSTIVAVIDKRTNALYDFIRLVYGYTPTSAQHIAKFSKEYGHGYWGCEKNYRYYNV